MCSTPSIKEDCDEQDTRRLTATCTEKPTIKPSKGIQIMASYCQEKFESNTGTEKLVCWRQDKHVHDAKMITAIEIWLGNQYGGTWSVRAGSYQSNKSSCGKDAVSYP